MRYRLISSAALVAALAVPASAQEHRGSEFTLGYTNVSDLEDGGSVFVGIKSDWAIGGAFGLQGSLGYRDSDGALSSSSVGLHGYYEFASGTRMGLFLQHETLMFPGPIGEPTFLTLGVEAMIALSPQARIELYAGSGDINDLPIPITSYTSYGAQASYDFSPSLRARISYDVDDLDAGLPIGSFSEMAVGIDYFLNGGGSGVPLVLSAEYTRASTLFSDETADNFTLKLTVPVGSNPGTGGRQLFGDRKLGETFVTYGG